MKRKRINWLSGIAQFYSGKPFSRREVRRSANKLSRHRMHRGELLEDRIALYAASSLSGFQGGAADHRIDITFLGDGFVESSETYNDTISRYSDRVDELTEALFEMAPFDAYKSYFNVHRVDVLSVDPGIDYLDESPPIIVNNALSTYILAGYLSADSNGLTKTKTAAKDAPDADIKIVIANTTSPTARATTSTAAIGPQDTDATRITVLNSLTVLAHELGHQLGRLADEYDSDGNLHYSDSEPSQRNLTTLSASTMTTEMKKWYQWLGIDGIGRHEGGGAQFDTGIFRPSLNSIMRHGTAFDAIGKEALIIEMYKRDEISTIDDATAPGNYGFNHVFEVQPMIPTAHELDIQWYVDDAPVSGANGETFSPSSLSLSQGTHSIKVKVTDNTTMVKDVGARNLHLTDTLQWTIDDSIEVQTSVDEDGIANSIMSLREAISLASDPSRPGTDKIVFAPSISIITLDEQLVIDSDVEIAGPGVGELTIDANQNGRAFLVESGVSATLSGISITGGLVTGGERGGGISNSGELFLESVEITGNAADSDRGGGIYNYQGSVYVNNSTISNNVAGFGGGIYSRSDVENSVVLKNTAVIDNWADNGGGVFLWDYNGTPFGSAYFSNSTFSGNSTEANSGGAAVVMPSFELTMVNCTVTQNDSGLDGGGIYSTGTVKLHNTILAENTAAGSSATNDLSGVLHSTSSYNLIGANVDVDGTGDGTGTIKLGSLQAAGLAPLASVGGHTKSHALLPTSPAIDNGNTSSAQDENQDDLLRDQVNNPRSVDRASDGSTGIVDIGAAEFTLPKILNVTLSSSFSPPSSTNPPYSFAAGRVGSNEQLKTVKVNGVNEISITFPAQTFVESGDLELIALNTTTAVPSVIGFVAPEEGNNFTARWTLATPLVNSQYALRLRDSIEDVHGQSLDGEWTNPSTVNTSVTSSTFPSGNDVAGGDFVFVFTILVGDATRDLRVNIGDLGLYGESLGFPQGALDWDDTDFTGDGITNVGDLGLLSISYNGSLTYWERWRNLTIIGDVNDDHKVDATDAFDFAEWYGPEPDIRADVNGDGIVNEGDLSAFEIAFATQDGLEWAVESV